MNLNAIVKKQNIDSFLEFIKLHRKLNTSRLPAAPPSRKSWNGFLLFLCPDAGRKEATICHATMPAL